MKKLIRLCGILLLVLLVFGLILKGKNENGGVGTWIDMLRRKVLHINVLDLSASVTETLDQNALYELDDSSMFEEEQVIRTGKVEKMQATQESVRGLDIRLAGCRFFLKKSEDDSYYIEYNGKGRSQTYVKEDVLYVKVLDGKEWSMKDESSTAVLYVPADVMLDQVKLELGAGSAKLEDFRTAVFEAEVGAGTLHTSALQAEEVFLSVGAGEIVVKEAVFQNAELQVGIGSCRIEGAVNGSMEADCTMGQTILVLEGEEPDFDYEIKTVTGNITLGEKEYAGLSEERVIANNASKKMRLNCAMGQIEVSFLIQ